MASSSEKKVFSFHSFRLIKAGAKTPVLFMTKSEKTISNLKKLSLKERNIEHAESLEKLKASARMHDFEAVRYYEEIINYLNLYRITPETLDILKRERAKFISFQSLN